MLNWKTKETNSLQGHQAEFHTVQNSSRGRRKGVVTRTPPDRATRHGNRGVVTRARLGDLKENWFLLFPIQQCQHAHPLAMITEDTVRPLIKRGEHEETPGFQNFAVFCPLCIVRGTGVCRTHIEVGYLVVAGGTGWG